MSGKKSKSKKSKLSVEQMYKKKSHHEHVLDLPDSYIGSVEADHLDMWVFDDELQQIVKREIEYIPGLYKIFDEVLVNARDHSVRDKRCRNIKINIDQKEGRITIWNDGAGIPVQVHKEHGIYAPELIFGHLLTSSNYEEKGKIVGGKNGYGAKLANIFSTEFTVRTCDAVKGKGKEFFQKYKDNMYVKEKPKVKDATGSSFTEISFVPDFKRFGVKCLTDDMVSLLKKRVYDVAACTNNRVKVHLNDKPIDVATFSDYIKMYFTKEQMETTVPVYEEVNDRWRVGVVYRPDSTYEQVSFVNGICTYQGGLHVQHVMDQILTGLTDYIKKKHKNIIIKNSHIKDNLMVFIDAVIEDPAFTSQTKEYCSNKVASFGSRCELSSGFSKELQRTGIVDEVVEFAKIKALQQLKKSDGKKRTSLRGMAKLDDADWAGGRKSKQCRLILTEGDSAKPFAIAGLDVIGRERYGVFPLRGKLLNVREATAKQLLDNEEIKNIKSIMGLKQNKVYNDTSQLRYGGIIILTDQDVDGSHIKGLIMNLIHYFWPSLLTVKGFIQSMSTPIIRAQNSKSKNLKPKVFYTLTDYRNWVKTFPAGIKADGWKAKYYKGLGTSTEDEAKDAFSDFEKRLISYVWETNDKKKVESEDESEDNSGSEDDLDDKNDKDDEDEEEDIGKYKSSKSHNALTLGFSKHRADDRKVWLRGFDEQNVLDNSQLNVTYSEFVDKELIHFSNEDNIRSIPCLNDGLKPSQRKILHACFLAGLNKGDKEMKVSQLAGFVSEKTEYHHGEASLMGAIINMAQDFIGSNNVNLLNPEGQFGTRREGGKDAASPRYIYTNMNKLLNKIFRKEDEPILDHVVEEGIVVEPVRYYPIFPMVLVNGADGIGTGFSSSIPCYNPKDLLKCLRSMIQGVASAKHIYPWYRNFKGKVIKLNPTTYQAEGVYNIVDDSSIRITELPVGQWTSSYRSILEGLTADNPKDPKGKILASYQDHSGNRTIDITINFVDKALQKLLKSGKLAKTLKLEKKINTSNMTLYNSKNTITKFDTTHDILIDFIEARLNMYKVRKEYQLRDLKNKLDLIKYKRKYIKAYIDGKLVLNKRKKEDILYDLENVFKFPKLHSDINADASQKSYQYLTGMLLWSVTQEKLDELKKEYEEIEALVKTLEAKTIESIWLHELDEFETEYNKWLAESAKNEAKKDKTKSKDAKRRGRKRM